MIMTKKAGSDRASFFPFIAVTPNLQKIRYAGYIKQDALLEQHIYLQQMFHHMCDTMFVIG